MVSGKNIQCLNLGCGPDIKKSTPTRTWINLDYHTRYKPEIVHDLDVFPYPFKKEQFDYIYCSHILEHVHDFFKTLKELERITKKGGIIHIRVPHFSNGNGYNDLTHRRFFGWFTFDHITNGYYNRHYSLKIVSRRFNYLAVEHPLANNLTSWFFNILPKQFYQRFLCWIFPVGEIEVKFRKI